MGRRGPSVLCFIFLAHAHVPMGCEGFANMFSEASGSSFGRSLQSKLYSHDGAHAKFFLSSHKETTSLEVPRPVANVAHGLVS